MSVEHMAVVLHHSKAKGTAKLVLLGIANHQGDGGAWPSLATLAKYASVHPRNVRKALETLRGMGEVAVKVQAGGTAEMEDHDRPNLYEVRVSCPPWCDRSPQHRDTRQRQPALWTNPRADSSPPDGSARPPRAEAPPAPRAEAPPKPSYVTNLESHVVGQVTTGRAREATDTPSCGHTTPEPWCSSCHPNCSICSLPAYECDRRAATSGHVFTPTAQPKEPRSA